MTVLQANESPIKSVKLFRLGGAEITRTFPLTFLRSQDEPQIIEIINLPASLHALSASVNSTAGTVTILDYHSTQVAHSEPATLTSSTLLGLETDCLRLEDERRLRQESFAFLSTYMDSLAQCKSKVTPEAAQMVTFFDDFVEIGIARSALIAELDKKIAEVKLNIEKETKHIQKRRKDLPVKSVVVLSCSNGVGVEGAELVVTYMVNKVSWVPVYDLRVATVGNLPPSTTTLDFRCEVTQATGENWDNVKLMLTTASQGSQLVQLPEPKKIDIGLVFPSLSFPAIGPGSHPIQPFPFQSDGVFRNDKRSFLSSHEYRHTTLFGGSNIAPAGLASALPTPPRGENRERVQLAQEIRGQEQDNVVPVPPPPQQSVQVPSASQPVAQFMSRANKDPITHIANGCIFVPSDGSAHHVLVASLSLEAQFIRVAVPSIDARVYYTCEVKNINDYVLLPGTVKSYLDDKHVSSVEIQNTDAPQMLECSLGVDGAITTINNRSPDSLPSFGAFSDKVTTTYTSATFVNNKHSDTICGVVIRSSLPLPADPRVTVVLKEPAGLTDIETGLVNVREGCQARWSTTGGRKGKQGGLFEWVCDLKPGTDVLKAVWEVCAPQGLSLVEQMHR
ncbi:hypothetical protein PAXRUDRAFT_828630 [Paxillus rubicundulus Ve08.2h10]|uniref:DUF4139 domain-containing protein n=1 Tax=Paxillus rubicundulus Ve08.2h10 TaxID=930991 RepID=A0A0D0E122_9AGAM|nr:hypothetical protein PAXRUDRAFT_828630 [Paxillus rubicundulus Ve08.2h10]